MLYFLKQKRLIIKLIITMSSLSTDEPALKERKSNQIKALLLKNLRLQGKQKGTNVCQILTPVICVLFTFLIKAISQENLPPTSQFRDNLFPYVFDDFTAFDVLSGSSRDRLSWYLYSCGPNCNQTLLGFKDGIVASDQQTILGRVANISQNVAFNPNAFNGSTNTYRNTPFFLKTPANNADLFARIKLIQTSPNEIVKNGGKDYLPDGAISFTEVSQSKLSMTIQMNDCRDMDLHRANGISAIIERKYQLPPSNVSRTLSRQITSSYGMLHVIDLPSKAFIGLNTGINVQSGYILMKDKSQGGDLVGTLIGVIGALLFPLALSLLFPVMLYTLVLEKEQKLMHMMKMNGLRMRNYWLVFLLFNLGMCFITNLLFFLLGAFLLKLTFFTRTSPALLILTALGWALAQIGIAAFAQTLLARARSANIVGYLVAIWTMMIASTLNIGAYQYPSPYPFALRMFPPFAFNRIFYFMLQRCSDGACYDSLSSIPTEMQHCLTFLYVGALFFFALGMYLTEVLPQELGVRRHPLFPLRSLRALFVKTHHYTLTQRDPQLREYICQDQEDNMSKTERNKVEQLETTRGIPLVINNLRKLYKKQGRNQPFVAVRSFNLCLDKRETFGLLGPNGAGKTTLISMLTGMFQPDNGNAWIGGYDITNNISLAQLQMGVCPQFDLLWPQLTVEEHLYFYARLKGISSTNLTARVQKSIQQVKLLPFRNFVASSLSGGMKRRLSIAISLVGDPLIVFLDQPSTGLDPQNRRQLWQVLANCQQQRALFITTHIMQEADALCHRVGIITHGTLRTVDNQLKLKKMYGGGYRLNMNILREDRKLVSRSSLHLDVEGGAPELKSSISLLNTGSRIRMNKVAKIITADIIKRFPGAELSKSFSGSLIFKIPLTYQISKIFQQMQGIEKELSIADISITNSSLEDVFINVVVMFDKYTDDQPISEVSLPTEQEEESIQEEGRRPSALKESQSFLRKREQLEKFGSVLPKSRESVISNQEASAPPPINPSVDSEHILTTKPHNQSQNDPKQPDED